MFRKPGVAEVGALRICHNLRKYPQQEKRARARKTDQLLAGVPEADSQFLPSILLSLFLLRISCLSFFHLYRTEGWPAE